VDPVIVALVGFGLVSLVVLVVAIGWLRRALESRLGVTDAELRRLGDAGVWRERGSDQMRQEIGAFREALDRMRAREEERRAREEQGWQVLHRVAAVLGGGQRTGRAGENVLRDALAHLPPAMVETDFRVNGRVVEFGLVLPDGRRLPIDSKWPAERELVELSQATDPAERDRLVRAIERIVAVRAREVGAYRDPALTAPVCVAAVPDAAYAVLRRAHADAYRWGVVVVPYSMVLPVVLFLFSIVGRFGSAGDVEACLGDLGKSLDVLEGILENKLARASTMLVNGTEQIRGQLGKARTTLSRAREGPSSLEDADAFGLEEASSVRPTLLGIAGET
jgi:hypothetical protein